MRGAAAKAGDEDGQERITDIGLGYNPIDR